MLIEASFEFRLSFDPKICLLRLLFINQKLAQWKLMTNNMVAEASF